MLKVLIFDFDGTLADTIDAVHEAINLALVRFGQPPITRARLLEFFSGSIAAYGRLSLPAHLRDDEALVAAVSAAFEDAYGQTYLHTDRCYRGVPTAVATLKKQFALGMLSNKYEPLLKGLDAALFPRGTFRIVHGVRAGVPAKPDPAVPLAMAAEFGAAPAECAFIGDSEVDIATAQNAGMHPICVGWGYRDEAFLLSHGAAAVARTPRELVTLIQNFS